MIKAKLSSPTGDTLLIGLSHENLARLVADEPIVLDAADVGLPSQQILIMAGKTEDEMAARLQQFGGTP